MEGTKKSKTKVLTIILAILLIFTVVVIIFLGYTSINIYKEKTEATLKTENLESKLSNVENENKELQSKIEENDKNLKDSENELEKTKEQIQGNENINVNEKVILFNNGNNLFYGYIDNGDLYYMVKVSHGQYDNNIYGDFIKFDKLTNIKKIMTYNEGTSVNPVAILLTEDGKIYQFYMYKTFSNDTHKIDDVKLLNLTKDLNINDFKLEVKGLSLYMNLTLKDGSQKNIEIDRRP